MSKYFITYSGKEKKGVNVYYNIEYFTADFSAGTLNHAFTLRPTVQLNPRMGNVSEPATRHMLTQDIYTHITYADLEQMGEQNDKDSYLEPVNHSIKAGDTVSTSNSLVYFKGLTQDIDRSKLGLKADDIAAGAMLEVIDINKKSYDITPLFIIKDRIIFSKEVTLDELGLKFSFNKIDPESGKIDIDIFEKKDNKREFIIMKAIIFPYINILWTGCILLIIGSTVAIRKRFRDLKKSKSV